MGNRDYCDLPGEALLHERDREGLRSLKKLPGVRWAFGLLAKYSYEKMVRLALTADSARIDAQTYPDLDARLEAIADALDVPRPDGFVVLDPQPRARLVGVETPVLILNTGLLELLDEAELGCQLGHELTHLKCRHQPYLLVADFLSRFAEFLPMGGTLLLGARLALEEWRLAARYTCDRGAALLAEDEDAPRRWLTKLGGGWTAARGLQPEAFLTRQAEDYARRQAETKPGRLLGLTMFAGAEGQFAPLRWTELQAWRATTEYAAWRSGRFPPPAGENHSAFAWRDAELTSEDWRQHAEDPLEEPSALETFLGGLKTAARGAAEAARGGAANLGQVFSTFLEEHAGRPAATPPPPSGATRVKVRREDAPDGG